MRWVLLLLMNANVLSAAEAPSSQPSAQTILFVQSDPRSGIEAQRKAGKVTVEANARYDIRDEHFQLHVPTSYDGSKPFGLMVWISAGGGGAIPKDLQTVCDKREVITVAADNSGNDRPIPMRLALALDAAFNVQRKCRIDASRIYASGISGGGKVASMLPVLYADTFCGAAPIVGVAFYRPVQLENDPTHAWPPTFAPPVPALLDRAQIMNRFVLITGTGDMNRESIDGTFKRGFIVDRFQHVSYVEVPDMGHQMPPAETLSAAIDTLDQPLPGLMARTLQLGQQAVRTRHLEQARALLQAVVLHGDKKLAALAARQLASLQPTTQPN